VDDGGRLHEQTLSMVWKGFDEWLAKRYPEADWIWVTNPTSTAGVPEREFLAHLDYRDKGEGKYRKRLKPLYPGTVMLALFDPPDPDD